MQGSHEFDFASTNNRNQPNFPPKYHPIGTEKVSEIGGGEVTFHFGYDPTTIGEGCVCVGRDVALFGCFADQGLGLYVHVYTPIHLFIDGLKFGLQMCM